MRFFKAKIKKKKELTCKHKKTIGRKARKKMKKNKERKEFEKSSLFLGLDDKSMIS